MAMVLKVRVNVDGQWYEAGTGVPAEVAERITNPKVWLDTPASPGTAESGGGSVDGSGGEPAPEARERPRGNASRDDWAAYATAHRVEFDENASRDEIRAAVDNAEATNEEG